MSLKERLSSELKDSLKSGDRLKLSTIRLIMASLKNREIEKRGSLSEEEIIDLLVSLSKQRKESIEEFKKGGRQDLVDKETEELKIIESYLPQQLTPEEIKKIIGETITETGASGPKDIGKVMKVLMPKVKGRVDGKLVNEMVKELLG
ncbi:MAG: GatB/YqeY domain-containing protein [Nitrospirae bacterium]|nr:GatB/YqeY domain-containing protein [Nitrospirota bacterium]